MHLDGLYDAVRQWQLALGEQHVITDGHALAVAETATFETSQRVPAILRPQTVEQVQLCLRIGCRFGTPVYPVSSGRNWGYGSRVPPANNCALLDLSRLDRIIDFNEELGYVTVEPGVTQRQLYEFLQARQSRLWMDATGSSPDCSLIGNAVERGFGHTPYGDHFAYVCGLQVVLPDGDVIETGAARFPNSLTSSVVRWGVGPSLDGLFSQSNFGVVTRMTVWLMPAPETFEAFFFRCESRDGLARLVDSLRDLRLREILRSSIHIGNDYKVLAGLRQYPWDEAHGKTPLMPELMEMFRKQNSFGFWNASGALYGTARQVTEAKRLLHRALRGQPGKLKFLNERTLGFAKRFATPFKMITGWDIRRTVQLVEPVLGLMKGIPTTHSLASAYWRKRTPVPADPDPDHDRCGLLWYAPVSPADGNLVQQLVEMASRTLLEHGFEPLISLTLLAPRTVSCVISITYDRDVEGQDNEARKCYEALVDRCNTAGYYPYRLGSQSMKRLPEHDSYSALIRKLKAALDPKDVLAPGRYAPTEKDDVLESQAG